MKKVKGKIVKISDITEPQRRRMFNIMSEYYAGVTWESFINDLEEKNHVILLSTKGELVGFSTLLWKWIEVQGKKVVGVFSGDTILMQEYWGTSALGICFLQYLWTLKFRYPLNSVYWFLISKGYKTYLLMANNFRDSFPRPERPIPPFERELRDHFYSEKFGDQYSKETGVITFKTADACRLKQFVAPINDEMRERYPRLRFFESVNPGWEQGQELACITRLSVDLYTMLVMPTIYVFKKVICGKFAKLMKTQNANPVVTFRAAPAAASGSTLPRRRALVLDKSRKSNVY